MQVKAELSSKNTIHIALAVYDPKGTYSRHAGVVMASVLRRTESCVHFHVLHDETLSDENRRKLSETYEKNVHMPGGCVHFIDVSSFLNSYYNDNLKQILGIYSKGSVFRLTMPDVLSDVDRIIYLDCDTVVNLDIAELWTEFTSKGGYSLLGWREMANWPEPDLDKPQEKIHVDGYGLSRGRYLNSGVLLMNLNKIRTRYKDSGGSLFQNGIKYISLKRPEFPDQDFLNAEFLGDVAYIDLKYNEVPIGDYDDIFNCKKIFHFYTKGKPWNVVRGCNADILYWDNLMHTPWRDELVVSFYNAAVNGEYYHRHSRDCEQRLWIQLIDNIKNIRRIKFRIKDKIDYMRYMKEFKG